MITDFHRTTSDNGIHQIFNQFLVAYALYALYNTDILLQLQSEAGYALPDLADQSQQSRVIRVLFEILADARIVAIIDQKQCLLTDLGREVIAGQGFFVWLIGGYQNYFSQLKAVLAGEQATLVRDERMVAISSGMIDQYLMREHVGTYFEALQPACIADLGCGDATRLSDIARRLPNLTGFGVERSSAAVAVATHKISDLQLSRRFTIIEGDCLAPITHPLADHVDCVASFFLLHDLLTACNGQFQPIIDRIIANFPNVQQIIFADTVHSPIEGYADTPPIFARGFELVHAMMGVQTRTLDEYLLLMQSEQFRLADLVALEVPNSYIFRLERVR